MVPNNYIDSMDSSMFNVQGNFNQKMVDAHRMKRNLTLNLHENSGNKHNIVANSPVPVLSTPDVNKFKLSAQDIVELFPGINAKTPTPTTPSSFVKTLNDDYSQTLASLTNGNYDPNGLSVETLKSDLNSNHGINDQLSNDFINIENQYPATLSSVDMMMQHENITIKEEPQTVPSLGSSPRLSPIDMDTQEAIKLERKRSRNRLAASKCRKRKLERIAKLEEKVKSLKVENNDLNQLLSRLKAQVYNLKQKVVKHYDHGCMIPQ